jgi:hypothetical protein
VTAIARKGERRAGAPGDHRCTPTEIWQTALEAIDRNSFTLDPCWNPDSTVPTGLHYDGTLPGGAMYDGIGGSGSDGLTMPWIGDVWVNPPFSAMKAWVAKVELEYYRARSITFLGPGDTSVGWWHHMARMCDAWAPWSRRVHFPIEGQPKGSPTGGVHLFYCGPQATRWRRAFEAAGHPTFAGVR